MQPTGRVFTDTSDFAAIGPGDEIHVGGRRFLVRGDEREYRFGIEDPKFWVKKATDIDTGERKILKLSHAESFTSYLAGDEVHCYRDPAKESAILDLVAHHPDFMHGITCPDSRGNPVRVIDPVRGINFLKYLDGINLSHDVYFQTVMPDILRHLITAIEAIGFLHVHGFRHGDIRNDHIFVEHGTGRYVWIDFDYDFDLPGNPFGLDIFAIGNLLIYAIGKGFHNYYMISNDEYTYKDLIRHVGPEDFSMLHRARLVNLRKHYPYIPATLNNVLLHFSRGAKIFYTSAAEIVADLKEYLTSL